MDDKLHIYDDLFATDTASSRSIQNPAYENIELQKHPGETLRVNRIRHRRFIRILIRHRRSLGWMLVGLLIGTLITSIVSVTVMKSMSSTCSPTPQKASDGNV